MAIIDNQHDNSLYQAIVKSIGKDSVSLDIEVGYFYLCGFELLSSLLKHLHVRILVGSYLDPSAIPEFLLSSTKDPNTQLDVYQPRRQTTSMSARAEAFAEGVKKIANQSAVFDTPEAQKSYKILEEKLENGTLEIKMTQNKAHGKFYVLKNNDGTGAVFMGSSNFTFNGLVGQEEINEIFETPEKIKEYAEKFEDRWRDSKNVIIQEKGKSDLFLNKVKNELWMNVVPSPYLMYVRILEEIFGREAAKENLVTPASVSGGQFKDFSYQLDAVRMALVRLEKYDGALIADVVGLGKSIIACAVAANLDHLQTVIVSPPHLTGMWEDYAESFRLRGARIFSSGKVEEVYEKYHTSDRPLLVIVDEAHRYRNEESQDYQLLHKVCRSHVDNKVLVLSATPFNNSPADIFSLIKLFQTPGQSTLRTVESLSIQFLELEKRYKEIRKKIKAPLTSKKSQDELDGKRDALATQVRLLIDPIIIRRTRLDLERITRYREGLKSQHVSFSKMRDPNLREYNLGDLTDLYVKTLKRLTSEAGESGFMAVRYMPSGYIALDRVNFAKKYADLGDDISTAQKNVASFMKRLLVMRFESSREAFRSTLEMIIKSHANIIEWIEKRQQVPIFKKGYIPSPDELPEEEISELEESMGEAEEEIIEGVLKPGAKKMVLIDVADLKKEYEGLIRADMELLKGIQVEWFGENSVHNDSPDPKIDALVSDIQTGLVKEAKRKIVVFSSYADTVSYVGKKLSQAGIRVFAYTSKSPKSHKDIIRKNFDASLPVDKQSDDFDVIVATDAISEGFNLHRAGHIINFDIPYNPTRVIQRIGRINRINKKMFDELYIDNYFPTAVGEQEIHIQAISTLKIKIFNAVVGSESRTLTSDESLISYYKDEFERLSKETESWDTRHREEYDIARLNKETLEKAKRIPMRCRVRRENQKVELSVGVGIRGENMVSVIKDYENTSIISTEQMLSSFFAKQNEIGKKPDEQFDIIFEHLKNKLFEKPAIAKMSGNRTDAVQYIKLLISEGVGDTNYCEDLIKVIRDLDDIPDGQLKEIVKIGNKVGRKDVAISVDDELKHVESIAPRHQLKVSLEKAEREENATNAILFSQEHKV